MASASDEGDGLGVVRVKPLGVGGGGVERSAAKAGGGAGREHVLTESLQGVFIEFRAPEPSWQSVEMGCTFLMR